MHRLYRSRRDRVLLGVCGGIARYFHVDPVLVRVIWVLVSLTPFPGIIAYIIAAVLMPEEPAGQAHQLAGGAGQAPSDGPSQPGQAGSPRPGEQAPAGQGPGAEAPATQVSQGDESVRQRTVRLLGWGLVVGGAIVLVYNGLVMAGVGRMLRMHFPIFDWNYWWRLSTSWWPLLLIILGVLVLWRGVRRSA